MEKETRVVDLPKFLDERGNLSFLEGENHVPFEIKRAYWIYDVPGGEVRGGHAYKSLNEFIIAISGSFDVIIDDGQMKRTYHLNRSYYGLYVPNLVWRQIENFSTNSLGLILASEHYNEKDYIRDYKNYLSIRNEK